MEIGYFTYFLQIEPYKKIYNQKFVCAFKVTHCRQRINHNLKGRNNILK